MKNKEFWKGAVAGALVVTCIGTGVFAGTGLAAKGTALGDRKCTSKLAYLEELIDRYYLGDKDEEKLQEGLYAGLLYGLDDPYSRYYTAEEYDSENSSNEGSYVGIGILMEKNKEGGVKIVECYEGGPGEKAGLEEGDIVSARAIATRCRCPPDNSPGYFFRYSGSSPTYFIWNLASSS